MPPLWKIYCDENRHAGQWLHWYRAQCAAFGWPPQDGFRLHGPTASLGGWSEVRNVLPKMQAGDWVVISLPGHRIARLGEIVRLEVGDEEWKPLVRSSRAYPHGENGRRIVLRWDMTVGPEDRDMVVQLPVGGRFAPGYEQRGTIRPVTSLSLERLISMMNDSSHWVPLVSTFDRERALSDYIAAFPHRLEDGMVRHPSQTVRERCFPDRTRSDVILQDRESNIVVVECKQHAPTLADLKQLKGYIHWVTKEFPEFGTPRGILVHGGARRVHRSIMHQAKEYGFELVYHRLNVDFLASD